eukprot:13573093-Alexandrium_andersonii.AAC.1
MMCFDIASEIHFLRHTTVSTGRMHPTFRPPTPTSSRRFFAAPKGMCRRRIGKEAVVPQEG